MIGNEELQNFKNMWTWLIGYPAHDREYYMKHVAKREKMWVNSCSLANGTEDACDGCRPLWNFDKGSLCTDPDSPLYKWRNTDRQDPDKRTFFASQVAVLAMNVIADLENESPPVHKRDPDFIHSQLHG